MLQFPIALNLQGQRCLIVGGGQVAYRKAVLLAQAGAVIDVIAPEITTELQAIVLQTTGKLVYSDYLGFDFHQYHAFKELVDTPLVYRLVIAATNNMAVNHAVYQDAERLNIMVNVVDDLPHCRFTMPAIIDRSPIQVAISTGGASPVLARQLRTQIEMLLPHHLGTLAQFSQQWRAKVKTTIVDSSKRKIFWESVYANQQLLALLQLQDSIQIEKAHLLMQQMLATWQQPAQGEVYIVGAGPGDPELLTIKALRLMQQADVVVYDRLVSPAILALCRRDAEQVYVGKSRTVHTLPQEDINQLLATLAEQGKRVCRLKGGDPFIFGRGGEEAEILMAAKIPFQIVPGVTAASGCAAYAGIPLTHRDCAQSVRFLTGHLKASNVNQSVINHATDNSIHSDDVQHTPDLPWQELVYENQTLVMYMGLVGLESIMNKLMQHGLRGNMPVALIAKGTTPEQQVIIGTVSTIAGLVKHRQIQAPTLTIVGEVVAKRVVN